MNPDTCNLAELADALARKDISALELTRHYLARIARLNPDLNCVISVLEEEAQAEASASDERRARGELAGPLDGLPVIHKDVFCTEGALTTCGSRMLANFRAPYDATVVRRAREAGLVTLAKANMDEFAMGSSTEHSYFGPARNPWDPRRVPGGSSGGSAAAVAAGLAPVATATDTGGSIRQPAAFCGVTGIKPTYGRVSRHGMVAFASSLDQGGAMARDAAGAAAMLQAMAGFDPLDSTSAERDVPGWTAGLSDTDLRGATIGMADQHFGDGLDPVIARAVEETAETLRALGATIKRVSLEETALSIPAYYVIALAEASSNLSRYDGVRFGHRAEGVGSLEELYERSRSEGFGDEVKRRIMLGTFTLSAGYYDAYYRKAQQLRRIISEDYARVFEEVDLLLSPVTPTLPFELGQNLADPVAMYLEDVYTCGVNLAGLPALSMPAGQHDGLPIGAQLIAPAFREGRLLAAAHAFQSCTDWHRQLPPLDQEAQA